MHKFVDGLAKRPANYSSLTPLSLLERSARVFPDRIAVIDDDAELSYRVFFHRCRAMASALIRLGITYGDTVSVLAFNTTELLESHYSVPMAGGVLNALNTRLDAATLRLIIEHGEARVLFFDTEFEPLIQEALADSDAAPTLIAIARGAGQSTLTRLEYEALVANADKGIEARPVRDEWDALALNYTSGTTDNPKGVVYHHRGAYLAALGNAMAMEMTVDTVYLWTLPMFHCNGWCCTWAVTAVGGTHVCLRKVEGAPVLDRIHRHGVTHMCGAPIVLNMLLDEFGANGVVLPTTVQFALGGASPPSAVIQRARDIGFDISHLYGLTETYGPATLCVRQSDWVELPLEGRARKMARQGVGLYAIDGVAVAGDGPGDCAPADGRTLGELLLRGNTMMKGYLKNPAATDDVMGDGWFHTGDLAVMHEDGYVEIKDRIKDIIISGGENISSQEVEEVLYRHPDVAEAAVVAMPHPKWGETPCAFVHLRESGGSPDSAAIIRWCRDNLPHYKVPTCVVFGELPKTATGKIRKNALRDRLQETSSRS